MAQRYFEFRGRREKLVKTVDLMPEYFQGDVLDVGCDQKTLGTLIDGRYLGVDFCGKPDVCANLENGLPFRDRSFDTVTAFDVLEHCDRIHFVLDELFRVSRTYVVVGLPNMYEWHFRANFLLGKKLSGKYGLPIEPVPDRHRWLLHLGEAAEFALRGSARNGFRVVDEAFGYYKYRKALPRMLTSAGQLLKHRSARSLFVYLYLVVMERTDETAAFRRE